MPFPKRQVTRAYKTVRGLVNGSKKRKSYTDMHGKTKYKRSRTMNVRRKYVSPKVKSTGSPSTAMKFEINHKGYVIYDKNASFDQLVTVGSGVCSSTTGTQGVWARSFLTGTKKGLGNADMGTSVQDMYESMSSTATALVRAIRSTEVKMQLLSASTGLQRVTVYFLKAQKDTAAGTYSATYPVGAWTECAQSIPTSTAPTVVGQNPYVLGFGSYWKICSTKRIVLNPGQGATININTMENWCPSKASMGSAIESGDYVTNVRNRTYAVMIVNQGFPVSDQTTPTLVNVGAAKLNITWHFRMRHSPIIHASTSTTSSTNAMDPYGSVSTAMEVNDDDGTVRAHATA